MSGTTWSIRKSRVLTFWPQGDQSLQLSGITFATLAIFAINNPSHFELSDAFKIAIPRIDIKPSLPINCSKYVLEREDWFPIEWKPEK